MTDAEIHVLLDKMRGQPLTPTEHANLDAVPTDQIQRVVVENEVRVAHVVWNTTASAVATATSTGSTVDASVWMPTLTHELAQSTHSELVEWCRKVGVPAPHQYRNTLADLYTMRHIIKHEVRAHPELHAKPSSVDWYSYVAEHSATLGRNEKAASLTQLMSIVASTTTSQRIRVVGSGHSGSRVALATGCKLISIFECEGIALPGLPDDAYATPQLARADHRAELGLEPGEQIVRIPAGVSVRATNVNLDAKGLALRNLGSYDGQSVAGAALTGTHGSAAWMSTIVDEVVSADVLTVREVNGQRVATMTRVEGSTTPLTDKSAFDNWAASHPDWELRQDDDLLKALAVSFGCMGIVVSVSVRVRPSFWLKESLEFASVEDVLATVATKLVDKDLYYEVLYNPYRAPHHPKACLVRQRRRVPPGAVREVREWPGILQLTKNAGPTATAFAAKTLQFIKGAAGSLQETLTTQKNHHDGLTSISFEVLKLGIGNYATAPSMEAAVPVSRLGEIFERLREAATDATGHPATPLHTSPVGIRFVGGSAALLAANRGDADEVFVMVETPMLYRTHDVDTCLDRSLNAMLQLGGRPHWGQKNNLTSQAELVAHWGVEAVNTWKTARTALDPDGVFSNLLSDQLGL